MTKSERSQHRFHDDPGMFREALNFTASETGFSTRLIEKDYFCGLMLEYLGQEPNGLVFKGGTCLAKVHADFYRLSEDLDFVIPMPAEASRADRRKRAAPLKLALINLLIRSGCFRETEAFHGANESTQYLCSINYPSSVSGEEETIKLEVSLREPLLTPVHNGMARTLLLDPVTGNPMVSPVAVPCISMKEAMAEKIRAALTRREPAIRDLFDIAYAVKHLGFDAQEPELIEMVRRKLAVPGNSGLNKGAGRLAEMKRQQMTRLRPVLRDADYGEFNLEEAFKIVSEIAEALS